jgi:hypothetical protein
VADYESSPESEDDSGFVLLSEPVHV